MEQQAGEYERQPSLDQTLHKTTAQPADFPYTTESKRDWCAEDYEDLIPE
jgi:hypothetical protein